MSITPIGLDFGAERIKAAQLAPTRRGWRIVAASAFDRLEPTDVPTAGEVERLAAVLDRAGFVGEDLVVGAPRSRLHTAVLELPPRKSGAPIEQICHAEVSRMFRLTPNSYELRATEIPSLSSRAATTQMAASVLPWSDAEALVAPLEHVGLSVAAIDLTSEATARACAGAMQNLAELGVLVDLGSAGLDLVVFRAGESVYHRRLDGLGTSWMAEAISRKLLIDAGPARAALRRFGLDGVDPGESVGVARARAILREQVDVLLQEMLSSIGYALDRFPGEAVSALRLVGGGARIPGLVPYLAEVSGLPVETVEPRSIVRSPASRPGWDIDPSFITAVGHALWGSVP